MPLRAYCLPPTRRYESEGGPSIRSALGLLANSEDAAADRSHFLLAQLAFWLLAATDGHGKNFSIFHHGGGTYRMTPLYDILSAWPVIGHGKNQLALEKAKLAMAVRGRSPHYRIDEIAGRHWHELAGSVGVAALWERMQRLVASVPAALEQVAAALPRGFPEHVYASIRAGALSQSRRFAATTAR